MLQIGHIAQFHSQVNVNLFFLSFFLYLHVATGTKQITQDRRHGLAVALIVQLSQPHRNQSMMHEIMKIIYIYIITYNKVLTQLWWYGIHTHVFVMRFNKKKKKHILFSFFLGLGHSNNIPTFPKKISIIIY